MKDKQKLNLIFDRFRSAVSLFDARLLMDLQSTGEQDPRKMAAYLILDDAILKEITSTLELGILEYNTYNGNGIKE